MKRAVGKRIAVALALLIGGGALILFGVLEGGAQSVWEKAIRICFECMGLG